MRTGTNAFRLLLAIGWAVMLVLTVQAVRQMGVGAAGDVFIGDFAHPWRAQFNGDFALHLLLVAAWMIYRMRSWLVGLVCAVLAINLGALFTFAYLLIVSIRARGDMRKVLLGRWAES